MNAGLCASCVHVEVITSSRGSIFYLCRLSFTDAGFPKYPALPVLNCVGYRRSVDVGEPADGDRETGSHSERRT